MPMIQTQTNNSYLYNFISSSYLFDYDESYHPILGMESSIALYLFKYSRPLFFTYPYIFKEFSLVSDSYKFFNICCCLLQNLPSISSFNYTDNTISYKFLDTFFINIYNYMNSNYYLELYNNNEIQNITYKGLVFNTLPIESIIAYCIQQYYIQNKNLQNVLNIIVLCTIYKTNLMYNTILSNLLLLKLNTRTVIKQLIKDLSKINIGDLSNFPFTERLSKDRTLEVLEFCYG